MTAHDAVSRVSIDVINKLYPTNKLFSKKSSFAIVVIVLALINWFVITAFAANMASLVALATFVSFVMAPLIGWMNLKTVTGKDIQTEYQPNKALKLLSYLGMVFLTFFSIYYCWMVIF